MFPKMIPNPNYLSTGPSTQRRLNKSEIVMGEAIRVMILKALCSQEAYVTSCTDSFLCVIKTFFSPFKNKMFERRCFISWRSSCLAAGLVFENRSDVSVESTWARYSFSFSKVVNKLFFKKEIFREVLVLTLTYCTSCLSLSLFHLLYQPVHSEEVGSEEKLGTLTLIRRGWRMGRSPRRTWRLTVVWRGF